MATPISINDLPKFSDWPGIISGAKEFSPKRRTKDEVLREYDLEKWGRVLAWLKEQDQVTFAALLKHQGVDSEKIIAFSRGSELFSASAGSVLEMSQQMRLETLRPHQPKILVELGCGLGDKLLYHAEQLHPDSVIGGEFTSAGVECGKLLAQKRKQTASFSHFDYYKSDTLKDVPPNAVIYTSHSIEQIPHLPESFIEGIIERSPQIVAHFEPCYADHDEKTLMGLLRRRYAELNDYNRNLLPLLHSFESAGKIRIMDHQKEIFGANPFNPTSVILWRPA